MKTIPIIIASLIFISNPALGEPSTSGSDESDTNADIIRAKMFDKKEMLSPVDVHNHSGTPEANRIEVSEWAAKITAYSRKRK